MASFLRPVPLDVLSIVEDVVDRVCESTFLERFLGEEGSFFAMLLLSSIQDRM